jgi:hypothetical protein
MNMAIQILSRILGTVRKYMFEDIEMWNLEEFLSNLDINELREKALIIWNSYILLEP